MLATHRSVQGMYQRVGSIGENMILKELIMQKIEDYALCAVTAHSKGLTLNGKKIWSDDLCDFEMSLLPVQYRQIESLLDKTNINELEI